jgi:tRNA threonylcarbamoyladenosine biosynthesis protein TsaB
MNVLAIDTSGQTASVAIVSGYITVGEFSVNAPARHAEIILPMLDELFRFSGYGLHDMDIIACVSGPGSFTGLRIGAATAMGLQKGTGKEKNLAAVPTLDALAYNVVSGAAGQHTVMPMLDARRGQVYTALYRADGGNFPRRVTDYLALPVEEALRLLQGSQPAVFLGDGAFTYKAKILDSHPAALFAPANANRQRAASAGVCALHMIENGCEPLSLIQPMYIRKPQAVRERENKL